MAESHFKIPLMNLKNEVITDLATRVMEIDNMVLFQDPVETDVSDKVYGLVVKLSEGDSGTVHLEVITQPEVATLTFEEDVENAHGFSADDLVNMHSELLRSTIPELYDQKEE